MDTTEIKLHRKHFSQIGLIMFLGALIAIGLQYLASMIVAHIPALSNNVNFTFIFTMLPMYVISFPIIFALLKRIPVQISGEKKIMKPSHFFMAFLICYAMMYVSNFAGSIITTVINLITRNTNPNSLLDLTVQLHPAVIFLIMVIAAPIMEELLFRKFLIDRTAGYGDGISIFLSGLMFGLFHGNLNQFIYAFALGAFFGFIYIKTRNLLYTIILHMIINFLGGFVSTLLLKASGYLELIQEGFTNLNSQWLLEHLVGLAFFLLYAMGLLVLVILGIVFFAINQHKFVLVPGEITVEKRQRIKIVVLNIGMILYCIFWIGMIIYQLIP